MKTNRAFTLLGVLLLVACAGAAAWLDHSWFMGWRGNRAADFNPVRYTIGDGQKIFAGHFYRKADVYYHSGTYPSIFDNNESFKTAHIGEDAGATGSKNSGDEENFLGGARDIIDRFSRNFFPSRHTHLDEGGVAGELGDSAQVREILPWLKIAHELDPENPLTYIVTAYWLRTRMNKVDEAERVVRQGLVHLPNHPALLYELGRIHLESHRDVNRARNVWQRALREWARLESGNPSPDWFVYGQIHGRLAVLEEQAGNVAEAIAHWEQVKATTPSPEFAASRIDALQLRQTESLHSP